MSISHLPIVYPDHFAVGVMHNFRKKYARATDLVLSLYPALKEENVRIWIRSNDQAWYRFKKAVKFVEYTWGSYSAENHYTDVKYREKIIRMIPWICDEMSDPSLDYYKFSPDN